MLHTSVVGTPVDRIASTPSPVRFTIVMFVPLACTTLDPPSAFASTVPPSCLQSLLPQHATL
jgi:hypothetical protein